MTVFCCCCLHCMSSTLLREDSLKCYHKINCLDPCSNISQHTYSMNLSIRHCYRPKNIVIILTTLALIIIIMATRLNNNYQNDSSIGNIKENDNIFAQRQRHLEKICLKKGLTSKTFQQDLEHNETTQMVFYNLPTINSIFCV